jgi:peptide/nickel transport system substrate-binding protein
MLGLIGGTGLLAACAPTPPTSPGPAITPAPAAAPTAAPAASSGQAKPAAPVPATTAPAPAPATTAPAANAPVPTAAAKAEAPKPGPSLIGKLEGPTIVTDPAQYPKTFAEAPMLTELVKAGKLPPLEQRLPQDPLVVKPVHEIGKYGGTWRRGFSGPADKWGGIRPANGPDHLLFWDYTGNTVVPNVARAYEVQDGGKTIVLQLRRGMKWSDGQPLTADDFVFWYEDILLNKDLVAVPFSVIQINGKLGKLEKVDAATIRFVFPEPYWLFPEVLAGSTLLSGHAPEGYRGGGSFAPAHYLKQFHAKYAAKDDLDKKVAEAKADNWATLFKLKNDWTLNPDLPTVTPWRVVTPANTPSWTMERNPYSMWVDTAGNQLPYIDKMALTVGENLEVINLRAVAGEYDLQDRHLDISKVPVFLESQQRGGYKLSLDTGDYGSDMMLKINVDYDADPEVGKWLANTDFRRALALGIDRDQINETYWLGTGTPSSVVPADTNKYNPGPEYRKLWATLDVAKANAMLDKLGLDKKDGEGFRLRTDGKGRLSLIVTTYGGQFVQYTQICDLVRKDWQKIGIELVVQEVERGLGVTKSAANEVQIFAWVNDGSEHIYTYPVHVFPFDQTTSGGPRLALWFQSGGTKGKEPPPRMKEVMEKFNRASGVEEAERIQLGKDIWKIVADEVYAIGIVGLAAAASGIRIAKVNMGNVPARQYNSPDGKNPTISRPVTFYYKS